MGTTKNRFVLVFCIPEGSKSSLWRAHFFSLLYKDLRAAWYYITRPGSSEPGVCFAYEQPKTCSCHRTSSNSQLAVQSKEVFHRSEQSDLSIPAAKYGSKPRKWCVWTVLAENT